jgi:uncharacterized YccA/Bax inhibitor family protein
MFRTHNPALKNDVFAPAQTWQDLDARGDAQGIAEAPAASKPRTMTIQGTVNKTAILLVLCIISAVIGWNLSMSNPALSSVLWIGGMVGGLLIALVTVFKPAASPVTAPLYALFMGAFTGTVSAWYAQSFADSSGALNTGLIVNAALLTFGIAGGLLTAYTFRIIRPGRMFRNVTITLTFGLVIYGLIAMVAGFFMGNYSLASVYDPNNGGMLSIGFSLFVIALASANLVLDYQLIEEGANNKAPKHMEWYGGFAVLVTLIWMYLEILRLLAKLQSRD